MAIFVATVVRVTWQNLLYLGYREKLKDMKQKARVKWASFEDDNTAFFHGIIKAKKLKNKLHGLDVNGEWCNKPNVVKREALKFFSARFKEPMRQRPDLACYNIKKLSQADANFLISSITLSEIKSAVWDCGVDRAPGPDGFNFKFIRRFWDIIGPYYYNAVLHFFTSEKLSQGCGASFIALIPKVNDPSSFNDFRPINLIGSLSKVISKVLANRIKRVIGSVISDSQSAFIKERNIIDGPLIINEVSAWLKKKK